MTRYSSGTITNRAGLGGPFKKPLGKHAEASRARTIMAVVLVGLGISGVLVYYVLTLGYGTTLTGAASITATWKTPFAVTYHTKTDFDTGALQHVSQESRVVTWTITAGNSASNVNIQQNYTSSGRVSTGTFTPEFSPNFYTGTISGSRLTVTSGGTIVGEFDFTSNNITGTWNDDTWGLLYTQITYTEAQALVLTKQ